MAKAKIFFFCKECGGESPKWFGQCSHCGAWGSAAEESVAVGKKNGSFSRNGSQKAVPIAVSKIIQDKNPRIDTLFEEVNRVLGGGIVPGSFILLGGEPGIGKSTLSLQLALKATNLKTIYVSGEESAGQIKLRADRLGGVTDNCYVLCETSLESILSVLNDHKPDLVIIDSIQTVYSDSVESALGGVSQIRECATSLLRFAKENTVPIVIIGHITKDGSIAGPKILEHIVDVVLQFEGDTNNIYRILRGIKNRFGSTSEIGVFEMQSLGLVEISNPSDILLTNYDQSLTGIAVGATIDGIRPYLLEIQSLVSHTVFPMPQRVTTGFDNRRLNMLLAVVEKRMGYKMVTKDIFLNIAGGFKVNDPGLDLAVIASILSSLLDLPISKESCFAAEVGLSGEVRPASRTENRVLEAARLGFKRIAISSYAQSSQIDRIKGINVIYISKVEDLVRLAIK